MNPSLTRLACLLFLSIFALLPAHAQQQSQLFGVQKAAIDPICSPDDALLTVSDEQTEGFQVWDVASRKPLWKSDDYFMCFSPPNTETNRTKYVMVARGAHPEEDSLPDLKGVKLELLDADTGKFRRQMDQLSGDDQDAEADGILDYGFSADGSQFRMATQNYLRIYSPGNSFLYPLIEWSGINKDNGLSCAYFAPKKDQVVAFDGSIVILNATTGALIRRFPLFVPPLPKTGKTTDGPHHLEVSGDESLFVEQFDEADTSRVYRLSDGKLLWSTKDWVTFSPDGKLAYVPSSTGLGVLDARTGRKLKQLRGPKEYGFAPSTDGNWLYEAREGKIFRWRTR